MTPEEIRQIVEEAVARAIDAKLPRAVRRAIGPRWVSPKELSKMAGLSERQVRYLLTRGVLPYSKVGQRILIDVQAVEELIAQHAVPLAWREDQ